LSELHIENLAVIPDASIELSPGLNVITGETGAGKTILAHAISLLLGTRADSSMVRPDSGEAVVEAMFTVPEGFFSDLADSMDVPGGDEIVVRRRISRDGRSRAYVGGRVTSVAVLEQLTGRLLAFSAQHEQQRLMMAERQMDILDAFAGSVMADYRDEFALLYDRRGEIVARLEEIQEAGEANDREIQLLEFQVQEIEAASLVPGEDAALEQEMARLTHAGELKQVSASLANEIVTGEGDPGLLDGLSQYLSLLGDKSHVDTEVASLAGRLRDSIMELEDLGREAQLYSESVVDDPARLQEVGERLELIGQLKRKYGPGVDEVIAHAAASSERIESLQGAVVDGITLERELAKIDGEMTELALRMRAERREAAGRLEEETERHLGDLSFIDCVFSVRLFEVEGENELTIDLMNRSGADKVEFFTRLNPGMPAAPLKETASGGELSRIMLAIKSAVSADSEVTTLVFDEIDAGIGGETGSAVGAKLKSLAADAQIICITHLPQIASFADTHFSVVKDIDRGGGTTRTMVRRVDGKNVVDELCRMMGSDPEDKKARAHAGSLLRKAAV
jgi:DNA repair protein RecN (Recombination protein N)